MAIGDVIAGPFALGYFGAQGLAYASNATLWNVGDNDKEMKNISLTATPITSWSYAGNLAGLSYDASDDTLWAVENNLNQWIHFSLTGTVLGTFSDGILSSPVAITTIPENTGILRIYDTVDETMWRVTKSGTFEGWAIGDVSNVNIKMIAYQKDAVDPDFRGVYFVSYFSPGRIENITGLFSTGSPNYTINTSVNQNGIAWDSANLWSVNSNSNELELLEIDGLISEEKARPQGYVSILF